jgi:hypothetical protein
VERASLQVQRAERQYQAVEPENRLVARTLEQNWEEALRADQQLREEYARFLTTTPQELSGVELDLLRAAASDVGALWSSEKTCHSDRKEMVRCLIERVVIEVQKDSEHVNVTIQWRGGYVSCHEIQRRVFSAAQQRDYDQLVLRIQQMHGEGLSCSEMAARLNEEGFMPARRRRGYCKSSLAPLLRKLGIGRPPSDLEKDEWWACDLARELEVTGQKIYHWARQGYVHARRTPQRHWIVWADADEIQRLHKLKKHTTSWIMKRASELTVPKDRPTPNA